MTSFYCILHKCSLSWTKNSFRIALFPDSAQLFIIYVHGKWAKPGTYIISQKHEYNIICKFLGSSVSCNHVSTIGVYDSRLLLICVWCIAWCKSALLIMICAPVARVDIFVSCPDITQTCIWEYSVCLALSVCKVYLQVLYLFAWGIKTLQSSIRRLITHEYLRIISPHNLRTKRLVFQGVQTTKNPFTHVRYVQCTRLFIISQGTGLEPGNETSGMKSWFGTWE